MRMQIMEWLGVGLVAVAAGFVHIALAIAVVGLYLFAAAVLDQILNREGPRE